MTTYRGLFLAVLFIIIFPAVLVSNFVMAETLYTYDDTTMAILKFNSSGQNTTFASSAYGHLACDSSGNLYLADDRCGIYKYNSSGYGTNFVSLPFSANGDVSIAFDNSGNLYAAGYNKMYKIDSSGNYTNFASGNLWSMGLAFNGSNCFYSVDWSGIIKKIDMIGNISTFVSNPSSDFWGVACDSGGNLYVSDTEGSDGAVGRILKIDPSGTETIFASGLHSPWALTFGDGHLYVGDFIDYDWTAGEILKFDLNGNMSVFATGLDFIPQVMAVYVPEPATMMILVLGGLAVLGRKRK